MHKYFTPLLALFVLAVMPARADQIISEGLIVQGKQCVGFDCVNGEIFNNSSLVLKENNTRIRFWDSVIGDAGGKFSWSVEANDSANGGANYLGFLFRSDEPLLSDGTSYPEYDCSAGTPGTTSGSPIPAGEPVYDQYCRPVYLDYPAVRFNTGIDRGVILGRDSAMESGEVSIGAAGALRRLQHLAEALADTDALMKSQMEQGALGNYRVRLDAMNRQLDTLESELADLEKQVDEDIAAIPSFTGGGGSFSPLLLCLLAGLGLFRLRRKAG